MTNKTAKRNGFTVIDGIVGLICLTLLAALALPCLLQMRGKARLDNCAEKMRKICLAGHNFHDSRKRLPTATIGEAGCVDFQKWNEDENSAEYWKDNQNTNSLALVSRYQDMADRYSKVFPIAYDFYSDLTDFTDSAGSRIYFWQGEIRGVQDVMEDVVDEYLCPEDDLRDHSLRAIIATQPCQPFEGSAMETLDGCRDIATQLWPDKDKQLGLSNYVACMGVIGEAWSADAELRRWRGAMTPRPKTTLEVIANADGNANTIMYGESLGEINDGERTMAMSWLWGGGARITGDVPFEADENPDHMGVRILGDEQYSSALGFGSKHDGVLYFALCDGSCHKVSKDIDREVLYQLAGAFDGGTPTDFSRD